ncbi:hypothetical protein D6D20_03173 [Aureobasidium pullulans]|uniref:Uncharacterized protein n=1 Tax=Aureobasidium pullulans TaxID=5580 RepID=A0A4S8ZEY0_AURPU|nr:hypothetical protein D6D20_03173 [Aureobasidium pullulans]TIA00035.1 hypothetical protein D6C82_04793 [Aureobasidium pullulans]
MPSQIILFDQSRSASHLLAKVLSKQPKLEKLHSLYSACRGKQVEWLTSDDWENGMAEADYSAFKASARTATADKILLIHDHPFSSAHPEHVQSFINSSSTIPSIPENFTSIPDTLLLHTNTIPVLTIRDPRLAVSSAYRVLTSFGFSHGSGRPNFLISTTLPMVIDADDIMTDPGYCRFEPELACIDWEKITEEEKANIHPMLYASQMGLLESTGLDASRAAKNLDFVVEEKKWDDEFGDDVPMVREMVESGIPHYQYLRERRLRM